MDHQSERVALEREIQQLHEELAGLGEPSEGGHSGPSGHARGVLHLKGAQDVNSGISKRVRSLPARRDRYYLELYLLQKERDRLVQEAASIRKRRTRLGRRLADIGEEMAERQQKAIQDMTTETRGLASEQRERPQPPKGKRSSQKKHEYKEEEWNRMSINY